MLVPQNQANSSELRRLTRHVGDGLHPSDDLALRIAIAIADSVMLSMSTSVDSLTLMPWCLRWYATRPMSPGRSGR